MNIPPAIIYILCLSLKAFELAVSVLKSSVLIGGLPRWHASGKKCLRSKADVRDSVTIPGLGRSPWRRAPQLTPVILPGESPQTGEPGGLQSMGSQRVAYD